jgi:hypothetical protein
MLGPQNDIVLHTFLTVVLENFWAFKALSARYDEMTAAAYFPSEK